MANEEGSGSRFVVDLGKVKLPRLVEKQVEAEIQAAVLRALAESGVSGDQQGRIQLPIRDQFPDGTLGLWVGDKPPIIWGSGGSIPTFLTPSDHTRIMKAIMEHPVAVLRQLPAKYRSKTGGNPSGVEVLRAGLQVEEIANDVKDLIRAVLDLWKKMEEPQARLPEPVKAAVEGLRQQLANKTVEEQRSVLRDAGLRSRHREDGLADGMDVAARILEDGQDSIYSPDFSFYKLMEEGRGSRAAARDALSDIGSADTIGGAAGGAVGSVAAGVGAGPGAVAGGAVASAGAIGYHIGSWIRGLFD
jgi:hypothetical protein